MANRVDGRILRGVPRAPRAQGALFHQLAFTVLILAAAVVSTTGAEESLVVGWAAPGNHPHDPGLPAVGDRGVPSPAGASQGLRGAAGVRAPAQGGARSSFLQRQFDPSVGAASAVSAGRRGRLRPSVPFVRGVLLPDMVGLHQGSLLVQLDSARSAQAALAAENDELRRQLRRWQDAGLKVAEREAKVLELLQHSGPVARVDEAVRHSRADMGQAEDDVLGLLSSSVKTYLFDAGKDPLSSGTNACRVLLIFLLANAVAFLGWLCSTRTSAVTASKRSSSRRRRCSDISAD